MENWFKRNKDLLVPTVGAIVVVLLLGGVGAFLNSSSDKEIEEQVEEEIKKIEIPVDENNSRKNGGEQGEAKKQPETFYIEPKPGQILEAIEGLDPVALDEKSQEFPGLKVMWPLYFFKIEEDENKNTYVYLDVSETGFGITVICDVDVSRYPEIQEAKSGDLIWVAGEIDALDPTGTGQFYIKTEQIRFGGTKDKPPPVSEADRNTVVEEKAENVPATDSIETENDGQNQQEVQGQ